MTFWIQHGYGKASKIEDIATTGHLTGVVLSPADEEDAALASTIRMLHGLGVDSLLDPQFYVHTIADGAARCHESHGLDFGRVSWYVSPAEIDNHASSVVATNQMLGFRTIIAPSPYQSSFGDVWSPLSLQYARATIDAADRPVYVSLVAEDTAFADWEQTLRYLDALTTLDAAGVYMVVGTSGKTYPLSWEPERLANIIRTVYTLAEYNRYDVLWGYSDFAGILGLAAGATGAATGWFHSLRFWATEKWVPKTGGRQANPRIFVTPILSSIGRNDEAVSLARSSVGPRAFPDRDMRRSLVNEEPWGIANSWNQHLGEMARLHQTVDRSMSIADRVAGLRQSLVDAVNLLNDAADAGAAVDGSHRRRLAVLIEALDKFVEEERL